MGERPAQEIVLTVHLADIDPLINLGTLLAERLGHAAPPLPAEPEPEAVTPEALGLVPWTFYGPAHKAEVTAYLDDHGQVRHVPLTRTSDVPKAWRKLWVET